MDQTALQAELTNARQLMALKRYPEALTLYLKLVDQYQQGPLYFEYGSAAAGTGDFVLADHIWQKLVNIDPNNAQMLWQLAGEYAKLSLFGKAGALYAKAAALEPQNLQIQLSRTSHLSRTAGTAEARVALKKCLELDSGSEWSRFYSAHIGRFENNLTEAERGFRELLAAQPRDPQLLSSCHLELARILDSARRFDEAMVHLKESKKIATQFINVEAEGKAVDQRREKVLGATRALPKDILEKWSAAFPSQSRAAVPPVAFLGGHIRSGTTLIERIIDAHPAVAAYDESWAFQTIVPLINVQSPEIPAEKLNFLRQRYVKNLTADTGLPEGKTLLDKNPGGTTSLPGLLRAFPELRVLIALRDPRDVLVSSYFIRPTHVIHLSLERMAQNYTTVMDVWLAVREWKGLKWMETRYEDVVADLEKEGRRVTDFLGLEWHESQARYYEGNREKGVKNYNEVTKPVYTKAMGRWRAYEKHLAPVLPILEPYCKLFGYS